VAGDHFSPEMRAIWANADTLRLSTVYRVVSASDTVTADYKGVAVSVDARVAGNPRGVAIRLRDAFRALDLATPPQVLWMRDQTGLSDRMANAAFVASLFTMGALICLSLAAFGVYGIVAQSVAQRRREIAVRLSLGATPRGILQLILSEGRVYVLAGSAVGLYLTGNTIGWISGLSPTGTVGAAMLAFISAALFALAGLAAFVPALRASAVDPASALRSE
jgi:ABC-type antimicrobial peptide transport system permease subunit